MELRKKRESLCRDLRIGHNVFDRGKFRFRKKERVRSPIDQAFVHRFLRAHVWTDDPERLVDLARKGRDQKWLGRANHMRKLHRPA